MRSGLGGMEAGDACLAATTTTPRPAAQGLENALKAGAKEVAIFTAASEAFSRANTNVGIDDGLRRLSDVAAVAGKEGVAVRGYVSCVVGCPYQVRCGEAGKGDRGGWRPGRGTGAGGREQGISLWPTPLPTRHAPAKPLHSNVRARIRESVPQPRSPCPPAGLGGAQGGGASGTSPGRDGLLRGVHG